MFTAASQQELSSVTFSTVFNRRTVFLLLLGRSEKSEMAIAIGQSDTKWMDKYRIAAQIGSGKYSDVFMVFTEDARAYAMKIMKTGGEETNISDALEGIPHVLREIGDLPEKKGNTPEKRVTMTEKRVTMLEQRVTLRTGAADGQRRVHIFPLLFKPITGNELLDLQVECKKDILKQIMETYNAAAKKNLYHRNLDPTNVLVDRWTVTPDHATVFVIGWSHTVLRSDKESHDPLSFEVGLTRWRYPDFEHLTDQSASPAVDARWRFCCFAYWLMTGRDPILPEHPDPCSYVDPGIIKSKARSDPFGRQSGKKPTTTDEKVQKVLKAIQDQVEDNVLKAKAGQDLITVKLE